MTPSQEREAIETRFQTNWASLTPVAYENFPFRPSDSDTEWAELFVLHNAEENVSIGDSPSYRRHGIIQVNIFVKKNSGSKRWSLLCETAAVIFRNQEFSSITCKTVAMDQLGDSDVWYKASISIDFFTTN